MSGVELATAYVSLAASAQGLRESVRDEFRLVERDAQSTGQTIGQHLVSGVSQSGSAITSNIENALSNGSNAAEGEGQNAGAGFAAGLRSRMASASTSLRNLFSGASAPAQAEGEQAGASFSRGMASKLKDSTKLVAAAGVGGLGAMMAKGFADSLDLKQGTAKLTAQLGLSQDQAARAGTAAGKLFSSNMGDSADISEAMKSVIQDIDGMRGASEKTLESMGGKALTVSKTFDQDLGGVTRAVSQMMRTGMAKSADEAFDIITKGFQSGANKSDDLLDTLNEYGTQFRKVGLSGADATGLINQGLQGGARDADLVADAVKEFSIRAVDGSKTTVAAYKDLGLNAEQMTSKIAKGGPAAKQGLGEILTRLRAVKDPAQQAQIATSLFGTQAEDLGKALFALHPEKAAKGLGQVAGATDKANAAVNSTPQAKLQNFIRSLQGGLVEVLGTKVIPAMEKFQKQFEDGEGAAGQFRDALEKVRGSLQSVSSFVQAHPDLTKGLVAGAGGLLVAKKSIDGISSAMRGVSSAASTVQSGFSTARDAATSTGRAFSQLKAGLSGAQPPNATAWTAAGNSMRNAGSACKSFATNALQASRAAVVSAASATRQALATAASRVAMVASAAASRTMAAAQWVLNAAMNANPISLIVIALVALGAAFVVAWNKSETFRNIVTGAWDAIKGAALGVWNWMRDSLWPGIQGVWDNLSSGFSAVKDSIVKTWDGITAKFTEAWNWVSGVFKSWWGGVVTVISWPIDSAKGWITKHWDGITGKFTSVKNWVFGAFKSWWNGVVRLISWPVDSAKGWVAKHWDGITGKFTSVKNWVFGAFKSWWNGVVRLISWPVDSAKGWVIRHWDGITGKFTSVKNWVFGGFKLAWDGLKKLITDPVQAGKNMLDNILGKDDNGGIRGMFNTAVKAVGKIWDKLKSIVTTPINGVIGIINDPFISGFNKLGKPFNLKIEKLDTIGGKADGGRIPGRAGGGTIPGPWRGPRADNVLGISDKGVPTARVNPGEYITKVASTQRMERKHPGALEYINRFGTLPGHADGGFAGMPHANTGVGHTARGRYESYRPSVSIVALGNWLRAKGFDVGQHPAFGGVARVHMPTSLHYVGQALDVNADGMAGGEAAVFDRLAPALIDAGWATIWRGPGHYDHLHVDTGLYGVLNEKQYGPISKTNMIVEGLKSVGGAIMSAVFDPLKAGAFKLIDGAVGKFGGGDFTKKILGGIAKKAVDGAIGWGNGKSSDATLEGGGAEPTGAGSKAAAAWRPQIEQALRLNGITPTESMVQKWITQIGWESSGNPNAVQGNIGDINNKTGDLAKGLVQVIGSTFRAYHVDGTPNNVFDPVANLAAGINYARHRYGPGMGYIGRGARHGYADGGMVRDVPVFDRGGTLAPGINVVHNKLGRPEPLVRAEDVIGDRRGDITVNVTGVKYDAAPDIAREITHELRRHDAAGRYREVWA